MWLSTKHGFFSPVRPRQGDGKRIWCDGAKRKQEKNDR
jgi:hypothetical protein